MGKNKKICIFTATRAEYGLLYWLMKDLETAQGFELQIIVSGTHLSKAHGYTIDQIHADGFRVDEIVDLQLSNEDSRESVAQAMSNAMAGVAHALKRLTPDVFILLGDRYELLGAASAALIMDVPIFHLHGGEITEGAYDDSIRHAVTKMASWHGVAAEEYRQRIIQMGEEPNQVYQVGALGLDNIKRLTLLRKTDLEGQLNFQFGRKTVLVTFHPVTNEPNPLIGFTQMMSVLATKKDLSIIFTHPNADHGRTEIVAKIEKFVQQHPDRSIGIESLGQLKFLSAMQYVDAIIGNSSSGIFEAPSFGVPTVNIGTRQQGRIRAESVMDCDNDDKSIEIAIDSVLTKGRIENTNNPFGDGDASKKLIDIFTKLNFDRKIFQDQAVTVKE